MKGYCEDDLDEGPGCLIDFSKVLHNCLNSGDFAIDFMQDFASESELKLYLAMLFTSLGQLNDVCDKV